MWIIGGYDGRPLNDVWSSSDGVTWTQATANAAFDPRWGFSTIVFNNKMWVIGGASSDNYGDGNLKFYNDVWCSSDGENWTQVADNAAFSGRALHSSIVFKDKMWVIAGNTGESAMNDLWSSSNGVEWSRAGPLAAFGPRQGHTSVVFDKKLWVIAGVNQKLLPPNLIYFVDHVYYNDVWCSSDGISWKQAISEKKFDSRQGHLSVVFNKAVWVVGGSNFYGPMNDVWYSTLTLPIRLIQPHGGENFKGDSLIEVQWQADLNRAGSAVKLEVWHTQGRAADLGYDWNPGGLGTRAIYLPLMPESSDYRIRAISTWDPSLWDESDQPFTITGGPVRLNMPNGGESWQAGSNQWVWWQANPYFAGTAVRFELWRGGALVAELGVDYDPDGESLQQVWIPADLPSGSDYKLRLVSIWNPEYFDEGDGFISIQGSNLDPPNNQAAIEPAIWSLYE